ncbi:hypothetical protein [Pseudomonas songnenensis]|uniref:Uncharacterized protein n=1 Tax=Pseudomonas songnenensis TaxID=1176259 RepID=A0A482UG28_9PSED|nr:hypothetical protein [Pseudomonas songnenensis]RYJ60768.1 hypothetical protein EJA06_018860 [Pseudomonas songnenensis]
MINIGSTDLYINVPSLPLEDFKNYSTRLFDEWEEHVRKTLSLPDFYLALDVQEGSISAKSRILVGATALCGFLASYGAISSGVKNLYEDVAAIGSYLGVIAAAPFPNFPGKPRVRSRGEALSKLNTLFVKVSNGTISPDEAMLQAEKVLGVNADDSPEFTRALKDSFHSTPSQILLPLENGEVNSVLDDHDDRRDPFPSRKRIPAIRQEQYRVEIWRESRSSQRNVVIKKL